MLTKSPLCVNLLLATSLSQQIIEAKARHPSSGQLGRASGMSKIDKIVNQLTDEEIYRKIGQIVSQFELLKCYECAQAVMAWLAENGLEGKVIELRTTKRREYFILSARLEAKGVNESITDNGRHYGVEVRGLVFDNLSAEGMKLEDWRQDFSCHSGQFRVTYINLEQDV